MIVRLLALLVLLPLSAIGSTVVSTKAPVTVVQVIDSTRTILDTFGAGASAVPILDRAPVQTFQFIDSHRKVIDSFVQDLSGRQPLDSDLTAIAALTTTSFGRSVLTQADAAAVRTLIGAGSSSFSGAFSSLTGIPTTLFGYGITDAQGLDSDLTYLAGFTPSANVKTILNAADYAAIKTALALTTGTDVQAYDADLTTYAGITPSANVQTLLGAANYAAIRSGLGLVIGSTIEAWDADLDTYAGITPSANVQTFLGAANYAAMKTQLSLTIGTDVEAWDADLDYLAGFTPSANVKTILNAADNAAVRTALSLTIGTNVEAWDADLDYLAGFTPSANVKTILNAADYASVKTALSLTIGTNVQAFDTDLTTWAGVTPGTGIATALAANTGSAGAPVLFNGALGTPSSGTINDSLTYGHDLTVVPNQTGGWIKYFVTGSNVNITTTTGTGDVVTGLTTGTLSNSTRYDFKVKLYVTNAADANGMKVTVNGGGSGSTLIAALWVTGTAATLQSATINTIDTLSAAFVTASGISGVVIIDGFFTTGATAAVVNIKCAKVTGNTGLVLIGSSFWVRKADT